MRNRIKHTGLLLSAVLTALTIVILSGCLEKPKRPSDKLYIVTTTGMIKDAVENIGGNHVEAVALMGPGVDPHLYKASHGDLERLTSADIVFYNGLHLEGKMGEVLSKLSRIRPVFAVSEQIPESSLRPIAGFQAHDPHIWFDVKLWQHAVNEIANNLKKKDTVHAALYEQNRQRYIGKLDSLHHAIERKVLEVPESQRVLITAHDAFGYFGDAYKVHVRGLQGISTLSEFGLRDVTELTDFIISRKIKAIFVETSVSQKSIEAVIEGCKQKGWNVTIGGNLYSDAMGNEGTREGTYIGMVDANVRTITDALK